MEPQVMIAIYKRTLPPRPGEYDTVWSEELKLIWTICETCWNFIPALRPTMDTILVEVDGIFRHRKGPLFNLFPVDGIAAGFAGVDM